MTNIQSGYLKTKNGIQLMTTVPYPIGAIYLSVDNANPSKLFGGTWEQIAKGRTLVGVDTSQTEFNTVNKTGGEKTHTLNINEMPSHNHIERYGKMSWVDVSGEGNSAYGNLPVYNTGINAKENITAKTGNSQAHNNLQPYFTCYIWCRTA